MIFFWYFLIGFGGGALSGFMGVGGAVIMIPCLVYFLGFSQHAAQGTSLAILAMPFGAALGAWNYHQKDYVDIPVAVMAALGLALGAYLSSSIAVKIPDLILKRVFGVFLAFVAGEFLLSGAGRGQAWWGLGGVLAFLVGGAIGKSGAKTAEAEIVPPSIDDSGV